MVGNKQTRGTRRTRRIKKKATVASVSPPVIFSADKGWDQTMHGLYHWYSDMFQKLGWMVLEKSRGMSDKTTMYITSLRSLQTAIEQKRAKVKDVDHKGELLTMLNNVKVLTAHADKDLM
jgi:hypothetical protein